MYLITVEGGDGSGKGEAVRILSYLANKMAFPNVHVTHEPRGIANWENWRLAQ